MATPVVILRVDWDNDGAFTGGYDDVTAKVQADSLTWTRGRSADFSAEATGAASFTLVNVDDFFSPDRNWHDNPSFERGTTGWTTAEMYYTYAATSLTQVTDNATGAGTKAGEAVLTATSFSGVTYTIPYTFRGGVTYAVSIWLKSMSGNLNMGVTIGDTEGTDYKYQSLTITTSWAQYTTTWTPSADVVGALFSVHTRTAAAATVRIDAIQVNPGSTANTYIEAPTKGQLTPGRPVHIYATYELVDWPLFFGYIERLSPDAWGRTVEVTCYDPLRRMSETDVAVGSNGVRRSARDFRMAILEDYERGDRNLVINPHLATNLDYWLNPASPPAGGLSRITTDHCPDTTGTTCLQAVAPSIYHTFYTPTWNVPQIIAGVTYRASVWLKWVSGSNWVKIGLGGSPTVGSPVGTFKDVYIDGTWRKYSITYTPTATKGACEGVDAISQPFGLSFMALAAGTYLVDGAQVTRGQVAYPYSTAGTGRSPNWCANGSFDGDVITGWVDGWKNLVSNPTFNTGDASGWSGGSIAWAWGDGAFDPSMDLNHATVTANGATVTCNLSGTFKAGVTYYARLHTKLGTATSSSIILNLRSSGTPADTSSGGMVGVGSGWAVTQVGWTPSADRTDAQLIFTTSGSAGNIKIDCAMVHRGTGPFDYCDTGPGDIGSFAGQAGNWSDAKYGSMSHYFYTDATAGAGRIYDFNSNKAVFLKNQPYTLSMWVKPPSSMPYKVGIGANKGSTAFSTGNDGTWDEASVTGTLTANVWTQITVTWTPTADRLGDQPFRVCAYIYQTDATARSWVEIDGVRVIPGSSADAFEQASWDLGVESDVYATAASITGTALSCLSTINDLAMTRHWIKPSMTSPFYKYTTLGRAATKTVEEVFNNDMMDFTTADIDRESIINVVPITHSGGTEYYSDYTSVTTYGPRPGAAINGATFYENTTLPESVGAAMVARYKVPRARPTMTLRNYFDQQLWLELDDLITVTNTRLRVSGGRYLIAGLTTSVTGGGAIWTTDYQLEEQS